MPRDRRMSRWVHRWTRRRLPAGGPLSVRSTRASACLSHRLSRNRGMGECLLTTDPALAVTVPVAPTAEAPVPAPDAAPPPHLSPSSATMFRQCPRRWRHRYIERLEDP